MKNNIKQTLLAGSALIAVGAFVAPNAALAAACALPTGGADCEISADPAGALVITDGDTATVDTTITLTQTVDGADATPTGILTTSGTGITVTQTGVIGGNDEVGDFNIAATDTWIAQASIDSEIAIDVAGTLTVDAAGATVIETVAGGIEIAATGVVEVADSTTGTVSLAATNDIDIATGGVLTLTDTDGLTLGEVDGNGAGQGTVNVNEGFTLTNAIGGSADLAVLNIGAGVTLDSGTVAVDAVDLNVGAGSALVIGGDTASGIDFTGATGTVTIEDDIELTGTVDNDSGTAGQGTLVLQDVTGGGNNVISGAVGGTASLAAVNLTGTGIAEFSSTVAATTITSSSTGTLDFDGNVTGNVNLAGDGTVDLASGTSITGALDNTSGTAAQGTLITDTAGVTGAVGASNTLKTVTLNGTGTTAFGSTVNAADINFGGAGVVTFADDVTVTNDIDFANAAGTVTFADGADFTGTIQDTSDDLGTVNFVGSTSVTGNIGAASNSVLALNSTGAAGKTVAISGNVDAAGSATVGAGALAVGGTTILGDDLNVGAGSATFTGVLTTTQDINFTGNGTVTLSDAAHVIGDDVLTGTLGEGTLVALGAGTVTDDFGVDGTELGTLTLSGSGQQFDVDGAFEAANINNLGTNIVDVVGIVDVDAAQVVNATVSSSTTIGHIQSAAAATVDAAAVVDISVADAAGFIADGQAFTVIDGTGGTGVADLSTTITDDSFLLSFAQDTTNDEDLVVTASRTSSATAATGSNNQGVGAVLESLGTGGDAGLDSIQASINSQTSQEALDEALESLTPTVDGAFVVGSTTATGLNIDATNTRIASARTGDAQTGMVAGELSDGVTTWMKGFAQMADQDERDGVDGYEADTYGVAVGIDTENVFDDGVLGLSFSYANTDVDSDNSNRTESDIDSYQVTLYGSHNYSNDVYVSGMLGYAHSSIDQTRFDVGAVTGNNASADFDSDQYIAYAEVGKAYAVDSQLSVTPLALVNYQHISIDGYTETGSTANQSVGFDDMDILELGVGAVAEWDLKDSSNNVVRPSVEVGYRYDVIGDEVQASSTFTGGGASFSTNGADPAQSAFNAGLGLTYELENNWAFTADYDYQVKSDYDAHSASLRAGYKF